MSYVAELEGYLLRERIRYTIMPIYDHAAGMSRSGFTTTSRTGSIRPKKDLFGNAADIAVIVSPILYVRFMLQNPKKGESTRDEAYFTVHRTEPKVIHGKKEDFGEKMVKDLKKMGFEFMEKED